MEIAKGLKLPGYDDPEVNVLPLVKNSLEKPNSNDWLMIVDNADDMSLLGDSREAQSSSSSVKVDHQDGLFKYIPNSGAGSILYTTRSKTNALRLTGEGKTIHISEMSIADSKSLLRTKLNGETSDEESWIDLLETVERLPLAIVQAASYIRQNSWSVSKYLRHFHAQEENASIHFLLHDFHDKTRQNTVANPVFKTWIITVQQLEDLHPRAAEALWLMAFYNRQNIPRYLLLKRTGSSSANLVPSDNTEDAHGFGGFHHKTKMNCVTHEIDASSELLFDEAIGTLVAYSFINVAYTENGEKYTLHRLVQTFTRYWLKDYRRTADSWAMKSLYFLVNEFPKAEYEDWTKAAELLPHVQVIHTYQPTSNLPAREFGVLLTAVATYLRTKAQFPMAEDYIHQALAILSEDLGGEDPITMDAWYCLGHIHNGLGRFREAEKTYRLLIDYYSNALGKSHASVFHVASLLSSTLRIQKKYEEAEKLARQSVLGLEVLQDLEVEVLLRSKGVLSTILSDRGQFEESISIRREIVNAAQKEYGSEHPRSLQMQHHLAVTLAKMGEVEEAKAISQYVLILNERIFGPDDPRTINIVFNLALTLTTEGYYAKAEGYFRRVLENRSYYQRGGEVNTIRSMQGLAFCLENQKLYDDAAKYYQTAYDMIQMAPDVKEVDQDEIKDDLARVQGLQSNDTEANEENLIKRLIGSDSEIPQSEDSGIGIGTGGWGGGGGGGEGGGWHCHPSYIDFGN